MLTLMRDRKRLRRQIKEPEPEPEPEPIDTVIPNETSLFDYAKTLDKKVQEKICTSEEDIIDILENPSPKGYLAMKIGDRIIDLHDLEDYILTQIPKKSLGTVLRYRSALVTEGMKGYDRYIMQAKKRHKGYKR